MLQVLNTKHHVDSLCIKATELELNIRIKIRMYVNFGQLIL
jgi:hypothetical protein